MRPDKQYDNKLEALRIFFRRGDTFQSLDQMAELLGYANRAGAKQFLERLIERGFMERQGSAYLPTESLTGYPLFESVRAGLPFTPETQPTMELALDKYLIDHPASTYLVRVKGDSMKDAGIVEGDIVILDRSRQPQNGDIVIASLEHEVTLKYFERSGSGPNTRIRLIPANAAYEPIEVSGECEILGVVSGSVRKYR